MDFLRNSTEETIRVLIAEDDDSLREILEDLLTQPGRILRSVKNGEEAIRLLRETEVDLVLTDLMMPGADGIQILKEVKRLHPEGMVIIMTGYASLDSAIEAIRGGAYDYIRKPFKLDEMEIVIHNACEKISLRRENQALLQRLKEAMGEVNQLKEAWDQHLSRMLDLWGRISEDPGQEEIKLILNQINPAPPDYDLKREESQEKALEALERLVEFRKSGLLNEDELSSFKKILLRKWKGSVSAP